MEELSADSNAPQKFDVLETKQIICPRKQSFKGKYASFKNTKTEVTACLLLLYHLKFNQMYMYIVIFSCSELCCTCLSLESFGLQSLKSGSLWLRCLKNCIDEKVSNKSW